MSGKLDVKTIGTAFVIGIPVGLVFGLMISILTGNYVYLWTVGIPIGIIFGIILSVVMVKGRNKSAKEMIEDDQKEDRGL